MNDYIMHPIVAGVVLKMDNTYLLVQESLPQVYGLWNFPAGKVDLGESIEQAAIREAKEETGFDIEIIQKIDIYQDSATVPPKHAFLAEIIGGKLAFPPNEIVDAKWFHFDEIQKMKGSLRDPWIIDAISKVALVKPTQTLTPSQ